jgi:prepilin-type N-terminal cleavage/methylation domain-containing protein
MPNTILKSKQFSATGFSLVELLIAMTIVLSMLAILTSILSGINHQFRTQRPRLEAINNGQTAADTIVRLARMAGNSSLNCPAGFQVLAPAPSAPLGNGYFGSLRIQADWNPADCSLNGVEEDVTFSVKDGVLYLDANQEIAFVDRISAVRFQFFDNKNVLITDPQVRSADIAFIRVEIDTLADDGTSPTIISGASLRK